VRTPDLIYSEGEMSTRYIDPDKMIVEDLKCKVIELGYAEHRIQNHI